MTTSKQVFTFDQKINGYKAPVFCWSQDSSYCIIGTENRYVYIIDKRGKTIAEKELPTKGKIEMMDWDH